jgi:hypothetical protein
MPLKSRCDERQRLHADVGVDVEHRQGQHDRVPARNERGLRPFAKLPPRGHIVAVQPHDSLWRPGSPAARQDDRAIVWTHRHFRRGGRRVATQQRLEPEIALLE